MIFLSFAGQIIPFNIWLTDFAVSFRDLNLEFFLRNLPFRAPFCSESTCIGLKLPLSFFEPFFLYTGVISASFNSFGKEFDSRDSFIAAHRNSENISQYFIFFVKMLIFESKNFRCLDAIDKVQGTELNA